MTSSLPIINRTILKLRDHEGLARRGAEPAKTTILLESEFHRPVLIIVLTAR